MQRRNLLIAGIAVVFGLVAAYLLNSYFIGYERAQDDAIKQEQLARIVVATGEIGFGTPLTSTNTRLASWPAGSLPVGAFSSIEEATQGGRVALRPIVTGEPILSSKVSGKGGRATLASNLPGDMRAVSVPVNATYGVGGFVRAGDVVDVLLTRQIPGEGASSTDKMNTVVLENALVLAVDQVADENSTDPAVATTATLQTDQFGAQKLALATQVGTISLTLRNIENQIVGGTRAVLTRDLGGEGVYIPRRGGSSARSSAPSRLVSPARTLISSQVSTPRPPSGPSMTVVRGVEAQNYQVNRNARY